MVTPSRWFAGGRGLEVFRNEMLADKRLHALTDYPDSREVFAGVDIAGGISYFLWDSSWNDKCQITTISGGVAGPTLSRELDAYDRKRVGTGKSGSGRVDLGGGSLVQKKKR